MRACASTSSLLLFCALASLAPGAWAQEDHPGSGGEAPDEFSTTPYSNFGSFNEDEDEAEDTKFYQFGRFFGVSFGLLYEGATGNRGKLWGSSFPGFEFRFHYWFDFNFALSLGFHTAHHTFDGQTPLGGINDGHMTWVGTEFKYYFDTTDSSSGITFAAPHLLLGFGSYTRSQTPQLVPDATDKDSRFGVDTGAGIEFPISAKKTYFSLDGRFHWVKFKDSGYSGLDSFGIPNLNGYFYTVTGSLLFTW